MSNCLFEAAFEKILEDCKCAPGFHNEGGADAMEVKFSQVVLPGDHKTNSMKTSWS